MDKSIESNNSTLSPNFEIPCEVTEEEIEEEIPDEISRLLKHEERIIQPHKEPLEAINLGSEEDKKEVNTGAALDSSIKNNLICRYGVPSKIIMDNGSNLNNKMMKELCEE